MYTVVSRKYAPHPEEDLSRSWNIEIILFKPLGCLPLKCLPP